MAECNRGDPGRNILIFWLFLKHNFLHFRATSDANIDPSEGTLTIHTEPVHVGGTFTDLQNGI